MSRVVITKYEVTPELKLIPFEPRGTGLLTYSELAAKLNTSQAWVRRNSRRTYTSNPIPSVRQGKMVRFDWAQVEAWIAKRGKR